MLRSNAANKHILSTTENERFYSQKNLVEKTIFKHEAIYHATTKYGDCLIIPGKVFQDSHDPDSQTLRFPDVAKTRDDLKKEFRAGAEVRVRVALILAEIARKENIELDEKEVEAQTEQVLARYDEARKADVDKRLLKQYVSSIMKNEKVFTLLNV